MHANVVVVFSRDARRAKTRGGSRRQASRARGEAVFVRHGETRVSADADSARATTGLLGPRGEHRGAYIILSDALNVNSTYGRILVDNFHFQIAKTTGL